MGDTSIQWTNKSWNPFRGCTRVSEGCRNCYAEAMAARFSDTGMPYEGLAQMTPQGPRWTGEVRLVPEHLEDPLKWREPRRIFVNSMSDLFHEKLSEGEIMAIFGIMAASPQHTFQILTKRSDRMLAWFEGLQTDDDGPGHADIGHRILTLLSAAAAIIRKDDSDEAHEKAYDRLAARVPDGYVWPLPNVHVGVSTEDQAAANNRIPHLLDTPAAVRFLSLEPLLGPVNLGRVMLVARKPGSERAGIHLNALTGKFFESGMPYSDRGIDWVIAGGESGNGARAVRVSWIREIVAQCREAKVPVFVKQLGKSPIWDRDEPMTYLRDHKGGNWDEWPEGLRVREFPEGAPLPHLYP